MHAGSLAPLNGLLKWKYAIINVTPVLFLLGQLNVSAMKKTDFVHQHLFCFGFWGGGWGVSESKSRPSLSMNHFAVFTLLVEKAVNQKAQREGGRGNCAQFCCDRFS